MDEQRENSEPHTYALNLNLASGPDDASDGQRQIVYSMKTPEASEVADLLAVQQDLDFVQDACALLLDALLEEQSLLRATLVRALWSSALVAYVRCFATGRRQSLEDHDVERVRGEGALEFHRKMRALRSRHVAHSVNPFEFIKIGVMIGPSDDGEEGITGLACVTAAAFEPHPNNVQNLARLAGAMLEIVSDRAREQSPAIIEDARGRGLDAIKRWPQFTVEIPGSDDPSTIRPHG